MIMRFEAERRDDGSFHLKSKDLPGFHFIIGASEKPEDFKADLFSALDTHLRAIARQRDALQAKPLRIRERRVFELESA